MLISKKKKNIMILIKLSLTHKNIFFYAIFSKMNFYCESMHYLYMNIE